jgi:hypothetical protein
MASGPIEGGCPTNPGPMGGGIMGGGPMGGCLMGKGIMGGGPMGGGTKKGWRTFIEMFSCSSAALLARCGPFGPKISSTTSSVGSARKAASARRMIEVSDYDDSGQYAGPSVYFPSVLLVDVEHPSLD